MVIYGFPLIGETTNSIDLQSWIAITINQARHRISDESMAMDEMYLCLRLWSHMSTAGTILLNMNDTAETDIRGGCPGRQLCTQSNAAYANEVL